MDAWLLQCTTNNPLYYWRYECVILRIRLRNAPELFIHRSRPLLLQNF